MEKAIAPVTDVVKMLKSIVIDCDDDACQVDFNAVSNQLVILPMLSVDTTSSFVEYLEPRHDSRRRNTLQILLGACL